MRVHRSNRIERLLDALADVIARPLSDPFAREQIVVHSRGMAVWLQMQLAQRLGVWAGGDFPFPRRFIHACFAAVLGERASTLGAFDAQRLVWSVVAALPRYLDREAFVELRRFLADDPRGTKKFQLATRIAETFDQYVVYRPDVVLGWESGRDDDWQAILWRALAADTQEGVSSESDGAHAAALARELLERLDDPSFDPAVLPERVCVFGVTALPPFHLQILAAIGRHRPVHLFVPSPSREYWAEIRSHRELLRQAGRSADDPAVDELPAPSLLRSLGGVGRDFQRILEEEVDYDEPDEDLYLDPGEESTLAALQSDLLHLHERGIGKPVSPHIIVPEDDSIAVVACHSPMREVEVLHDRILDMLAREPTLQPRDIVVMMSDIDTYAPLVEAVFERDPSDPTFVPYCIADRSVRGETPVIEAFHRILDLVGGRVTASEVLDLLALEDVQRRFELAAEDVDTLTQWVIDSGIRWGIDGEHRRRHGQPDTGQNTWRFGLDRLLLGHALPGHGRETFAGVLPYDELEGQSSAPLGKLAELCSRLFSLLRALEEPRTVPEWQEAFGELIDGLLADEDRGGWEVEPLRSAIFALVADASAVGYDEPIALEAMRSLVDARIEGDRPPRGFLSGGVTLCAMLPMRTIPFRVVCLLGLGDTQFPRPSRTLGFDLMRRRPRPGDRSRRADDRYLFLEALMAARDRVLVSYPGQSIQDNSDVPPSVVLSELLDHLAETCVVPEHADEPPPLEQRAAAVRSRIVVRQPMQPFSPRCFGAADDPRLFSFARSWREGARALSQGHTEKEWTPLLVGPLPARIDSERIEELPLRSLVRFFRLPAAELLKRRLRVNLDDYSRDRSDREPMELGNLEEWKVGTAVVEHRLEALPPEVSISLLRASGDLPHGTAGACQFEALAHTADPIVHAAHRFTSGGPLPNIEVDRVVGRTRLVGTLGDRHAAGRVTYQYSRLSGKHLLAAWLHHLVQCLVVPHAPRTIVVARGDRPGSAKVVSLRPVESPEHRLEELLDLYWRGQSEPLLLFPRSSLAFSQALKEGKPVDDALDEARKEWTDRFNPEGGDPHLRRMFGDADVLAPGFGPFGQANDDNDFPHVSVRVFGPLLEHMEDA